MSRDAGISRTDGPIDGQRVRLWINSRLLVKQRTAGVHEFDLPFDDAMRLLWDMIDAFEITPGAVLDRRLDEIRERIERGR